MKDLVEYYQKKSTIQLLEALLDLMSGNPVEKQNELNKRPFHHVLSLYTLQEKMFAIRKVMKPRL